jgi:hypothetical protein
MLFLQLWLIILQMMVNLVCVQLALNDGILLYLFRGNAD